MCAGSAVGGTPANPAGGGGSTPTSALQLQLIRITFVEAMRFNREWHSVLPTLGTGSVAPEKSEKRFTCFAAVYEGRCFGVAVWSLPAARRLPQDGSWLELRRLAVGPQAPKNTASRMLRVMAILIQRLLPDVRRLCSLQDIEAHTGGIYKAAGWSKAGKPKKGRNDWNVPSRPRKPSTRPGPKQRWERSLA